MHSDSSYGSFEEATDSENSLKSNGLSNGESSYENKRQEIRGGSWLCFDLFNPAFEKTQALRAISHRVEEEVFHLLTHLMIHPEISRERLRRQV